MFKNKPFLVASIFFGGIAVLFFSAAIVSFLGNDNSVCKIIENLIHMKTGSFTNTTLAEIAVICSLPSFIFAFKSYCDMQSE